MAAFWRNGENVTTHIIDPDTPWPTPTLEVARLLERPLPSWLKRGPYPFVSPFAKHLLCQLQVNDDDSDANTLAMSSVPPTGDLARLFDTVMSTCASLRSIVDGECSRSLGPSPKVALLVCLIRNIMHVCMPDARVEENVLVVLPMHPTTGANPLFHYTKTASIAHLLVMHVADNFAARLEDIRREAYPVSFSEGSDEFEADERDSVEEEEEPRRWTAQDYDLPWHSDHDSQSTELDAGPGDAESTAPLDQGNIKTLPDREAEPILQAHLLRAAASHDSPALPVICSGFFDEISGVMASCLYQRHVWGCSEPVVGLAMSRSGTIVQVVFGWLEDDGTCDSSLPIVHVALAQTGSPWNPSSGWFDICDIRAAFFLAQFLLSLDDHVTKIKGCISAAETTLPEMAFAGSILHWRSDIRHDKWKPDYVPSEDKDDRIVAWVHEVAYSHHTESEPMSKNPNAIPPSVPRRGRPRAARTQTADPRAAPLPPVANSNIAKSAGSGTSDPPSLSVEDEDRNAQPVAIDDGTSLTGSNRTKRYSCSEFAAGVGVKGPNKDLHVIDWLAQRLAVTLHFPMDGSTTKSMDPTAKAHVEQYNTYTKLYWPRTWNRQADLPQVDSDLCHLSLELLESHSARQEYVKHGVAPVADNLPLEVLDMIEPKLSVILRACANARRKNEKALQRGIPEVECRHDWDALFFEFLKTKKVAALLERQLKLPRNISADDPTNDFRSTRIRYFHEYEAICAAYLLEVATDPIPALKGAPNHMVTMAQRDIASRIEQATAAHNTSGNIFRRYLTKSISPNTRLEPLTGKCDAIGVLHLPAFFEAKSGYKAFALLQHPKPAKGVVSPDSPSVDDDLASSRPVSRASLRAPSGFQRETNTTSSADIFTKVRNDATFASKHLDDVSVVDKLSKMSLQNPPAVVPDCPSLDLPLLNVEYKQIQDGFVVTGVNQGRMYSTACVKFLSALGIRDFPVFGLVTEGSIGAVTCSYLTVKERGEANEHECVYIMERDARAFDIATPIGAYNYATFLCMIATEHATNLEKMLNDVKVDFLDKFSRDDPSLKWTMKHQDAEAKASQRGASVDED